MMRVAQARTLAGIELPATVPPASLSFMEENEDADNQSRMSGAA